MSVPSRFLPPRRADAPAPEPARGSEAGDSLVEVLLAVVIIGITAVSLMAGFATSISASAEHRDLVTLDTILRSYAESATYQIQQASSPLFVSCGTTYFPTFTIPTGTTGYTVGISSVSYWNGSAFTGSCTAGSTAPQQITASATGPANTSDSLNFIVVDPAFQSPVGTPTQLVVTTEPQSSSTSGANFAVTVSVEDTLGNVVTTPSTPILLAIASNPNGGTLTCATNPVNASNGVSVFSCSIDLVGAGYTLTATSSTFGSVTTNPFTITAGTVSQLSIVSAPVSGTASSSPALGPITVQEQDAAGNPTTVAETVTMASSSTGAKFAGAPNGAAITSLSIPTGSSSATFYYGDTTSGSPIITVSSPGLSAGTQNEVINAGPAVKLAFNPSSPNPGSAGSPIAGVSVQVQDSFGNVVTTASNGTVALSIKSGSAQAAFTSGTSSLVVNGGVANFTSLVVNTPGSYTFIATPSGISGVTGTANSSSFSVAPGAATQLVITAQPPATSTAGSNVTVAVTLKDAVGNVATTSSGPVSLAISNNPGAGTLSCATNPVTATAGVTTFSCSINKAAAGYTLVASASGASSATTSSLTITPGAGTQLVITSTAFSATASSSPTTPFTMTLEDAYGNSTTRSTASAVTLSSTSTGTKEFAASSGGATVTSVTLAANTASVTAYYGDTKSGSPVITAAFTGLTSGTQSESVIAGVASKLVFTTQPAGAVHPNAFTTQPIIAIEDTNGNVVTTNTSAVTLAIGTNPTGGSTLTCTTNPVNASIGVATFAGCKISLAGTGYTLKATDGSLTAATSATFNVT
jgi:type II secretory pathway pseudopilin PulG